MKQKILIVEDEIIVALDLQNTIESFGYDVTDTATNYNEAIQSIKKNKPNLVLMDINLQNSQKNGIQIASLVQQKFSIPAIFLSAFCDEKTINEAILTNPVGYLTKPFKKADLRSNLQLAFYKLQSKEKASQTFYNDFVQLSEQYFYDPQNKTLYFQDIQVDLSAKETKLFDLLFQNKNKIVSFETIEFEIWHYNTVSSSTLRTLLYRLRSKLDHHLIQTIQKTGCKLQVI